MTSIIHSDAGRNFDRGTKFGKLLTFLQKFNLQRYHKISQLVIEKSEEQKIFPTFRTKLSPYTRSTSASSYFAGTFLSSKSGDIIPLTTTMLTHKLSWRKLVLLCQSIFMSNSRRWWCRHQPDVGGVDAARNLYSLCLSFISRRFVFVAQKILIFQRIGVMHAYATFHYALP